MIVFILILEKVNNLGKMNEVIHFYNYVLLVCAQRGNRNLMIALLNKNNIFTIPKNLFNL